MHFWFGISNVSVTKYSVKAMISGHRNMYALVSVSGLALQMSGEVAMK